MYCMYVVCHSISIMHTVYQLEILLRFLATLSAALPSYIAEHFGCVELAARKLPSVGSALPLELCEPVGQVRRP